MTFKEALSFANDAFFDDTVFADNHQIEYQTVKCVLDTDIHTRDTNHEEGLKEIRIYISQSECDKNNLQPLSEGQNINVDGTEYIVSKWNHEMGVHVVYAFRYGEQVVM